MFEIRKKNIIAILTVMSLSISECISEKLLVPSPFISNIFQLDTGYDYNNLPLVKSVELTNSTSSTNKYGIRLFSSVFYNAVQDSPQLINVFNTNAPAFEASTSVFQAYLISLQKSNVDYPEHLAKQLADAVYTTWPFMTPKVLAHATANTMGIYLVSQNLFFPKDIESRAVAFAGNILNSYPTNKQSLNNLDLWTVYVNGISAFLSSLSIDQPERIPLFIISLSKRLFALTSVSEPAITSVSSPTAISSAYDVYGISSFSETFINSVDSSVLLRSIFYPNIQGLEFGTIWYDTIYSFCIKLNCSNPATFAYDFKPAVESTYNFISGKKYVKSIANAYSLMMLGMGTFDRDKSVEKGKYLATVIERDLGNLPPSSNLQAKLEIMLNVSKIFVGSAFNYRNQFSVLGYSIVNEFYAASVIAKTITD